MSLQSFNGLDSPLPRSEISVAQRSSAALLVDHALHKWFISQLRLAGLSRPAYLEAQACRLETSTQLADEERMRVEPIIKDAGGLSTWVTSRRWAH